MRRATKTTNTSLVEAYLRGSDDFVSARQLVKALGLTGSQVSASLHHLRRLRVVDVVIETDGQGWWFALPPEEDLRSHVFEERAIEVAPRRRRKRRAAKP